MLEMVRSFMDAEVIPLEGEMLHGDPATLDAGGGRGAGQGPPDGLVGPQPSGRVRRARSQHGRPRAVRVRSLGRSPLGHVVFGVQAPDAGNVEILHAHATEEQRERYLRPLVEGKIRSCFSMTEPEMPGSNPVMMGTTAVKDGDDYVINGQKWFTSSADGADFAIVMAVTDPDAPPYQRASMIIVPTDTPGFNLVRNISVMGDAGSRARQPRRGHLPLVPGAADRTCSAARATASSSPRSGSDPGASTTACAGSGIAGRAFDMMCERANARVITPDGDTLADRQVIQHWVAELDAEIRGARLQTLHAAWMIDRHGANGRPRRDLGDQVLGRRHDAARRRQGDPGARRARRHRRHGAVVLVPPRAGRPHLRRRRRGPQDHPRPAHPAPLRVGRRRCFPVHAVAPQLLGDGCRAVVGDGDRGERAPGEPCRSFLAEDERGSGVAIGEREVLGHDGHRHRGPSRVGPCADR